MVHCFKIFSLHVAFQVHQSQASKKDSALSLDDSRVMSPIAEVVQKEEDVIIVIH